MGAVQSGVRVRRGMVAPLWGRGLPTVGPPTAAWKDVGLASVPLSATARGRQVPKHISKLRKKEIFLLLLLQTLNTKVDTRRSNYQAILGPPFQTAIRCCK